MWTGTSRERHRRGGAEVYPGNLTDAEWAALAYLIPPARPGGRPRGTDLRSAMDALFYLLRTGCPWRTLPRDGRFPPRSPVDNIFRSLGRGGTWEAILAALVAAERRRSGREAEPSAGVLDSQTGAPPKGGALHRTRGL